MKNKSKFWQVYLGASIVIIIIIAVALYSSFFSPDSPEKAANQYSQAQLIFTIVGITGVIFSLLFATHQFSQSQRSPNLSLAFADSKDDSITVEVPQDGARKHQISFNIENNGSNVAIWFEVIVDLSKLPCDVTSHMNPAWDSADIHGTIKNRNFIFKSLGMSAAFISSPLEIGSFTIASNSQDNYQPLYELPYKIYGDLEAPKHGKLFLKFNKSSIS